MANKKTSKKKVLPSLKVKEMTKTERARRERRKKREIEHKRPSSRPA